MLLPPELPESSLGVAVAFGRAGFSNLDITRNWDGITTQSPWKVPQDCPARDTAVMKSSIVARYFSDDAVIEGKVSVIGE